jgi:hypothetical protein
MIALHIEAHQIAPFRRQSNPVGMANQLPPVRHGALQSEGRKHRHLGLMLNLGPGGTEQGLDRRRYIRQKLEDDPAQPRHLITELQVGYRLVGL